MIYGGAYTSRLIVHLAPAIIFLSYLAAHEDYLLFAVVVADVAQFNTEWTNITPYVLFESTVSGDAEKFIQYTLFNTWFRLILICCYHHNLNAHHNKCFFLLHENAYNARACICLNYIVFECFHTNAHFQSSIHQKFQAESSVFRFESLLIYVYRYYIQIYSL